MPSFQPLFTVIVKIFSLILVVLPSSFNTCIGEGKSSVGYGPLLRKIKTTVELLYYRLLWDYIFVLTNEASRGKYSLVRYT